MTSGWAACISSARAPPNRTVGSRWTFQETLSGPKNPASVRSTPSTPGRDVPEQPARQQLLALVLPEVVPDGELLPLDVERERRAPRADLLADVRQPPLLPDGGLRVHVVLDQDRDDAVVDEVPPVDAVEALREHRADPELERG